jgi:multiple sugar transport system ATP-binding protein
VAEIRFEHVSKRFGNTLAVDDLSLTVRDQELLTLVGPSGCGKTTTLNMLAGLEDPSEGLIAIDGRVVNDVPPGARDIAMVFQSYALYPHMTVRENIGFGLKVRGMSRQEIERRVVDAARVLEIGDLLDRRPKQLSGGQRQRVALGRALTRDPKAFLLDEPLSNLDAQLRTQMRAELKLLFDRIRGTVVYVTHDQAEAMTLSDRLAVMQGGLLHQLGAPLDVYNHPANVFVAKFLGSPSMNFVTCELSTDHGAIELRAPNFRYQLNGAARSIGESAPSAELILGVRPEDVQIGMSEDGGGVPCRVELLEPMGSLNIVYATTGNDRLVATTEPRFFVEAGDRVWLRLDETKLHLFDRATERNLFAQEPGA